MLADQTAIRPTVLCLEMQCASPLIALRQRQRFLTGLVLVADCTLMLRQDSVLTLFDDPERSSLRPFDDDAHRAAAREMTPSCSVSPTYGWVAALGLLANEPFKLWLTESASPRTMLSIELGKGCATA
ncbi:hypothetical protein ACFZA1_32835 [Streptomyces filipinensis]|uniref:hypothetical protein n=1 Tax=Streptomyces filipinensis TaxID=66887 RepID=UPI0036E9061A